MNLVFTIVNRKLNVKVKMELYKRAQHAYTTPLYLFHLIGAVGFGANRRKARTDKPFQIFCAQADI
jgi:hypothetical protein